MALLHTISSVVRLPLRAVGTVVSTAVSLLPGHTSAPTPSPTDAAPVAPATPVPAARATAPAATGPTPDPAAPAAPSAAATKAPAKKAPAKKAAAKKAAVKKPAAAKPAAAPAATLPPPVVEPEPAPVTDIDAKAADEVVTVTPADIAATMGTALDEESTSSS
ncbi:hypothetical protein [Nocardioides rubriscoriae]|uniref:hypothetical protein n=1 Tax=Nocardioides rubriscoriae TaxID=642762 RepID=UPI001B87B074|nr:hypothetical protein [Nocardioides rubriscoriae]